MNVIDTRAGRRLSFDEPSQPSLDISSALYNIRVFCTNKLGDQGREKIDSIVVCFYQTYQYVIKNWQRLVVTNDEHYVHIKPLNLYEFFIVSKDKVFIDSNVPVEFGSVKKFCLSLYVSSTASTINALAVANLKLLHINDRARFMAENEEKIIAHTLPLKGHVINSILWFRREKDDAVVETCIYQELASGGSLVDCIESGILTRASCHIYARSIADSVAALHNAGVIHRDLKPDNILIRADSSTALCDFGTSRLISEPLDIEHGSLPYRAPELFLPGTAPSFTIDSFAFGCMLVMMLTQEALPWHECGDIQLQISLVSVFVEAIQNSKTPLDTLLARLLAPSPINRITMIQAVDVLKGLTVEDFEEWAPPKGFYDNDRLIASPSPKNLSSSRASVVSMQ